MPRAVRYSQYGDAEVLTVSEVPLEKPGPGQIRVRVRASGVNPIDWKKRRGLMAGGQPLSGSTGTGLDFAGVVDAVGEAAGEFSVGDRVAGGVAVGAAADYVLVDPDEIVPLADHVDFVTGAAINGAGTTAIRVLAYAKVDKGKTLLLHAATGGVGSFATQLAVARGVTVIGTTSATNRDYLASLGAIPVLYGDGWEERVREVASGPVHAVIDAAGRGVIEGSLSLVVPGGPIVTIADFQASGPGVLFTSTGEPGFENSLQEAVSAVEKGTVVIPIAKTFPLEEVADAQRLSETGHVRGKIVLTND